MDVAVGVPRPRFGAHMCWPPLEDRGAAAGGIAGGGTGKHAHWCCAWLTHPWVYVLSGDLRAYHVGKLM